MVKTNSGYTFELQFHTPQSLEIKEENHKLYEEIRLLETSLKRKQELLDLVVRSSNQIEVPVSVDEIKDRR